MAGTLNFDMYQCFVEKVPGEPKQFEVKLKGNDRLFRFETSDPMECKEWIETIRYNIFESKGFKIGIPAPITEDFWRHDQLHHEDFLELADTFDILLFKCNSTSGKVIRTYTNSEFGKYLFSYIST